MKSTKSTDSIAESRRVTFWLDTDQLEELIARAERHGKSYHLLAKSYVIEKLCVDIEIAAEREALHEAVKILNGRIQQFRTDFAFAVQALLSKAGTVSEEEAVSWVNDSINPD